MQKMIIRNLLYISLLSLMFAFPAIIHAQESQSLESEQLHQAIEQRKQYGLPDTKASILKTSNEMRISNKYGIYLSPLEEQELTARFEAQDLTIPEIRKYIDSNPSLKNDFVGIYIDQKDNGKIHVGFKNTSSAVSLRSNQGNVIKDLERVADDSIPISVYQATYTEEELNKLTNIVSDHINELTPIANVKYVSLDFVDQHIAIGLLDTADKISALQNELESITGYDKSVFSFDLLDDSYKTEDLARTSTIRPLQGGITLGREASTSGECSLGYSAIDSNSNPYVITAGHCWYGENIGIYQGGSYIGTRSNISHYGNDADAVAIRVSSNTLLSNYVYNEVFTLTGVETPDNDVIGQTVCMSGRNRGESSSCGPLQSKNSSMFWNNPNIGEVWFNNLRLASYNSTGGDSGGTVFHRNTLMGVNKGRFETGGNYYGVYSHVGNVTKRLGLTPKTW
ncbi:S1 family peptidase [Paenibacillus shenyangensis]|uniref:S1 family peptidase n=1 Tax=Paenibacillus sp. A9 TaxID=1284352 RepID=UPI00035F7627|nr:S1 family peptidase [Paenibacillus sp. A9]